MDKIKVEICCGTACYLLGAANLMAVEDEIPESLRDRVEVEARTCLELCEKENLGGAPYVRFNGTEIMAQATSEKVLERIAELAGGDGQDA
jgi:NADH:ubiquinone oxidoreductase subunit E